MPRVTRRGATPWRCCGGSGPLRSLQRDLDDSRREAGPVALLGIGSAQEADFPDLVVPQPLELLHTTHLCLIHEDRQLQRGGADVRVDRGALVPLVLAHAAPAAVAAVHPRAERKLPVAAPEPLGPQFLYGLVAVEPLQLGQLFRRDEIAIFLDLFLLC